MTPRNWLNFWSELLVVTLVTSVCLPARAQQFDKECETDDPDSCSQPLLEGETVPFSGQLLTPKMAIKLGQKAASFDVRLGLELERNRKLFELDLELEKKLHEIDQNACTEKVDLLTDRLETAQLEKWYQHPLFVATISVVLTSAFFVSSAYIYKSVSQ